MAADHLEWSAFLLSQSVPTEIQRLLPWEANGLEASASSILLIWKPLSLVLPAMSCRSVGGFLDIASREASKATRDPCALETTMMTIKSPI